MPKAIINIGIDFRDVFSEFTLNKTQMDEIRETTKDAIVVEFHRNWIDAAEKGLHQSRDQYIRGLKVLDTGRFSGAIVLTGQLPNMLESGCSAFDMKEGYEQSAKVKYNKNGGWFLTIPFRLATPDAGGFSSAFAGVLPQEIYDLVKNFNGTTTTISPNGQSTTQSGDRLKSGDIPSPYDQPKVRQRVIGQTVKTVYDAYVNKFSIYAGLQRNEKFYDAATQGTYNTFRRVGKNSDPLAFIHTGLQARNFAEIAKQVTEPELDILIDNVTDQLLSSWGFS